MIFASPPIEISSDIVNLFSQYSEYIHRDKPARPVHKLTSKVSISNEGLSIEKSYRRHSKKCLRNVVKHIFGRDELKNCNYKTRAAILNTNVDIYFGGRINKFASNK